MITVTVKKNNSIIKEITVKGHANFADYGNDIVCAATSSIIITSINGLLRLDDTCLEYKENDGFIHITILKDDMVTQTLITNMLELLKELEIKYSKNIKLN